MSERYHDKPNMAEVEKANTATAAAETGLTPREWLDTRAYLGKTFDSIDLADQLSRASKPVATRHDTSVMNLAAPKAEPAKQTISYSTGPGLPQDVLDRSIREGALEGRLDLAKQKGGLTGAAIKLGAHVAHRVTSLGRRTGETSKFIKDSYQKDHSKRWGGISY